MRQVLILITLILTLSVPAFSQNSMGDPPPLPDTSFLKQIEAEPKSGVARAIASEHKVQSNKKAAYYMTIETYTNVLLRQVSTNIRLHCKDDEHGSLRSLGGLMLYIQKREQLASIGKAFAINDPKAKDCAENYTVCMFKGQALQNLGKLVSAKYLTDYLHEKKKWPLDKAERVIVYLLELEKSLKPKP